MTNIFQRCSNHQPVTFTSSFWHGINGLGSRSSRCFPFSHGILDENSWPKNENGWPFTPLSGGLHFSEQGSKSVKRLRFWRLHFAALGCWGETPFGLTQEAFVKFWVSPSHQGYDHTFRNWSSIISMIWGSPKTLKTSHASVCFLALSALSMFAAFG